MLPKATGIIFWGRSIPFAPSVARENSSHEQAGLMASNSFLLGPGNFSGSILNLGVYIHMQTCGCSGIYKQKTSKPMNWCPDIPTQHRSNIFHPKPLNKNVCRFRISGSSNICNINIYIYINNINYIYMNGCLFPNHYPLCKKAPCDLAVFKICQTSKGKTHFFSLKLRYFSIFSRCYCFFGGVPCRLCQFSTGVEPLMSQRSDPLGCPRKFVKG